MPQKSIFTRAPLLSVPHSFLSCGLVRTDEARIEKLYQKTLQFLDAPFVWEGAFRLSCLLRDDPLAEPAAERILQALKEREDGSFPGSMEDQIAAARAALALFEYNTDRAILRRVASWCRYLEINWDHCFESGRTLFDPADLMELLVRFYQVCGVKSVLRLCAKLRSAAFDWTSSLHMIQQIIPLDSMDPDQLSFMDRINVNRLDFDQKQALLNHAVTLADGFRYTLFSGLFSGNGQDLSAGKTAWKYLKKRCGAVCGGTTAGPFLSGSSPASTVDTAALAAWAEAFASQMLLPESDWAVDELIRVAYNGLSACLNADGIPEYQRVNQAAFGPSSDSAALFARVSRAVAAVLGHGISVTKNGFSLNYLLPSRYILMAQKQPMILTSDGQTLTFSMRDAVSAPVSVFVSSMDSAAVSFLHDGERTLLTSGKDCASPGRYYSAGQHWKPRDSFAFEQEEDVISDSAHHQGVCLYVRNRLQAYAFTQDRFAFAAGEDVSFREGQCLARMYQIEGWRLHGRQPEDIPVLPSRYSDEQSAVLIPYDQAESRIALFPRLNPKCLK